MTLLVFLAGFVLLYLGGEALLRGAVALARALGVSTFFIGVVVVGLGTSFPELVTCIEAALAGAPGIAIGNAVGSNIANILLILGVAAVLSPIVCDAGVLRRDGTVMGLAALTCAGVIVADSLGRTMGAVLVMFMIFYVIFLYISDRKDSAARPEQPANETGSIGVLPGGLPVALIVTISGIAVTILGARLLVSASIDTASALGISQSIIGLTVVALGTSLPELATAIVAGLRGESDLAFGNIVGSNIYNVFVILGITSLIHPLAIPADIAAADVWVMLGSTALMLFIGLLWHRFHRQSGILFLCLYAGYVASLAHRGF